MVVLSLGIINYGTGLLPQSKVALIAKFVIHFSRDIFLARRLVRLLGWRIAVCYMAITIGVILGREWINPLF